MLKALFFATCIALCVGDIPERKVIRPCNLKDFKCIGDNLAANSGCNKAVRGSIPRRVKLNKFKFDTPYFNATYIDEYITITNQDKCYVSEFFFNMQGDTAVLALDCPQLGISANRTLIQHRSLQEDTTYSFIIDSIYPLIRLTTNLKHADRLDICSAYTYAEVTALPIFRINPNDKPTANFLTRDLSDLMIYERETFFYRGSPLFRYFVNAYICNFGCVF